VNFNEDNTADNLPERINPLRRVFVPRPNEKGFFRAHDGVVYHQDRITGQVRRVTPKASGKAARKAEKKARRDKARRAAKLRGES
jgi:hypothetical protein